MGTVAIACWPVAILALRLGAGFGLSQPTAYRYLQEVIEVLAARAPGLQEQLRRALAGGCRTWGPARTAAAGPAGGPMSRPGGKGCSPAGGPPAFRPARGSGAAGQVEGRTADDAAYWLAQASPACRDAVQVVAIGMCSMYASAVRRMLPPPNSWQTCSMSCSSP